MNIYRAGELGFISVGEGVLMSRGTGNGYVSGEVRAHTHNYHREMRHTRAQEAKYIRFKTTYGTWDLFSESKQINTHEGRCFLKSVLLQFP